jgi:hypothetical protein
LFFFCRISDLLFFKNEYILLAFWQLRKQNMEKAAEWLQKSQTIKLSFINLNTDISIIVRINPSSGSSNESGPLMKKLGIWSEYETRQSNGYLEFAAAAISKGRKQEGQKLEEAKRLDSAGMMTDQIKMMKDQLKMPTMQKHMHNPNMRNRGKFF